MWTTYCCLAYVDVLSAIFVLLLSTDRPEPRESLLHFSARLGLSRVTNRLLHKPGSEVALKLPNHKGHLPKHVALDNGHNILAELLSE